MEEFEGAVNSVEQCECFKEYEDIQYWVKRAGAGRLCWSFCKIYFSQYYLAKHSADFPCPFSLVRTTMCGYISSGGGTLQKGAGGGVGADVKEFVCIVKQIITGRGC